MFTLARRFRSTLLFAALASALVLADGSHEHRGLSHAHRHLAVNLTEPDGHIQKRFDNTRFTYFEVGQNACGGFDHDNDFIVALTALQWDGGSHCYEEITISYQGKSTKAKITDECEECPYAAIDLSPGLFSFLAGGLDAGEVYGQWSFGGGDPPTPTTSSTPPPPPPTTTHTTPKTTSTTHTTSTSHFTSTTHSTTSTTSTTPTSTSTSTTSSTTPSTTSSAPTATVTSWDTGNLNQFNLALIQLIDLSNAILASPSDAE
ncbi:hypothetical protein BD310DRAFT_38829 [Dichomitus squalens]|uniref:RlpA-like double-psi beta-barrel-protein domain-containing protein-containing protein n=1 Tax=Dichomitus squalens TaxID=114155 RepID=A0A4Q9QGH7_9APHY|nr:hypothetical protein BD310DRAFT_38829 [Dichomitus squalens]